MSNSAQLIAAPNQYHPGDIRGMSQAGTNPPPPTPRDLKSVVDSLNELNDYLNTCRVKTERCADCLMGAIPSPLPNTGLVEKDPEGVVHVILSRIQSAHTLARYINDNTQRIDAAIGGPD